MTRDEFENLVLDAIKGLPQEFLDKLDNVEVTVEGWPALGQLRRLGIGPRGLLFGLYQGTPKTKRTAGTIFPDKITIFAGPILLVSHSPEAIRKKVTQVVRHEIAHHFGMDDHSIRKTGH
jgi:predicted Zn-dependent protease with MMP-like domain